MSVVDTKIELTNLLSSFLLAVNKANNEISHLFANGLNDYLKDNLIKYYETTTFLHRDKKRFDDIYYPLTIANEATKTDLTQIGEFLKSNNFVSIIGTAGSGKSMIMKNIFLKCIQQEYGIPVFIELRKLNDSKYTVEQFIIKMLLKRNVEPSENILNRTLRKGMFVFVLDGYDELYSEQKEKFDNELEDFIDAYPKNAFLLSSRPRSGVKQLPRFLPFNVQDLEPNELSSFVEKIVEEEERRERLLKVITEDDNQQYITYFANPLLFSMFVLTFESHPEIPKKKSVFYQNVFETLYSKHDGINKNSYIRKRQCGLQKDEFEEVISLFSAYTFSKGKYYFTYNKLYETLTSIKEKRKKFDYGQDDLIQDLDLSISILVKDGNEYTFPHRSMQEYFTGIFIKKYLVNERNRKRFISTIIEKSKSKANDRHKNFWALLSEIDKHAFINYYLIRLLRGIIRDVEIIDNRVDEYSVYHLIQKLEFGYYYTQPLLKKKDDDALEETMVKEIDSVDILDNEISDEEQIEDQDTHYIRPDHVIESSDTKLLDENIDVPKHPNDRFIPTGHRGLKFRYMDNIYWDALDLCLTNIKEDLHHRVNTDEFKENFTREVLFNSTPLEYRKMYPVNSALQSNYELFENHGFTRLCYQFYKSISSKIEELLSEENEDNDEILTIFGD